MTIARQNSRVHVLISFSELVKEFSATTFLRIIFVDDLEPDCRAGDVRCPLMLRHDTFTVALANGLE
jgi:hypothetical protein